MLIESLIKPAIKPTRTVTVFGVAYEFTPVAKGRFVAKVDDQPAIDCFLALPKAYTEFTDQLPGSAPTLSKPSAPVLSAPAAPAAPPPSAKVAAIVETKDETHDASATADEATAAAQALLSSTPVAIKKQLEKNLPSRAVLTRAIALEKAADRPRTHVVANLTGVLSSLDA